MTECTCRPANHGHAAAELAQLQAEGHQLGFDGPAAARRALVVVEVREAFRDAFPWLRLPEAVAS